MKNTLVICVTALLILGGAEWLALQALEIHRSEVYTQNVERHARYDLDVAKFKVETILRTGIPVPPKVGPQADPDVTAPPEPKKEDAILRINSVYATPTPPLPPDAR